MYWYNAVIINIVGINIGFLSLCALLDASTNKDNCEEEGSIAELG